MSTMNSKVLIAVLALIVLVAMFEVASAQYYGRGNGYGGGYGRGGYGGGRGYQGYQGGRGGYGYGGRGYGSYGGGSYGGRGYGRGTSDYDTYPSSGGGYYDGSDDDFSSYMDVYTTSSSSFRPSTATSSNTDSFSSANNPTSLDAHWTSGSGQPSTGTSTDWTNSAEPQQQWALSQGQLPSSSSLGGISNAFDLITGADRSLVDSTSGRASSSSSSSSNNDKTRERSVLAPSRQSSASSALANKASSSTITLAMPIVPSSTTTAAPEYVMINPSRDQGTSSDSSDQDE